MFRIVVLFATLVAAASNPTPDVDSLFNARIVGGTVTDIAKHPHQVSMRFKNSDTTAFKHRCGGSILTSKIILTAAQCVYRMPPNVLNVVAGTNELNGQGAIVPVEKVIWHEDYYKSVRYENNIAILVLKTDLPLNDFNIKAIKMIDKKPVPRAKSTVTGWGRITESGAASSVLLEVNAPIVSNDDCTDSYGPNQINDSMLCAGLSEGGIDACHGDSGGPLVVGNKLAGVVSWHDHCARPDSPGIYADVAYLRSWIENVTNANS